MTLIVTIIVGILCLVFVGVIVKSIVNLLTKILSSFFQFLKGILILGALAFITWAILRKEKATALGTTVIQKVTSVPKDNDHQFYSTDNKLLHGHKSK